MNNKTTLESQIELLDSTDTAFAEVSLNPNFQWAKIVICDDQPNLNKMKIPESEFDNLIRTGINSPIKMDIGKITGHVEAKGKPIGVITAIKKETNKLIALAALWKKEREEDIAMLKDMFTKQQPPQTSWEIGYTESAIDDNGDEVLKGTMLDGLAIVASPAYAGRTSFVAMAEVWTTAYKNDLPDSAFLYIEPGGKKDASGKTEPRSLRHLPVKGKDGKIDPAHVRDAISRAPQIKLKDGSNISPAKADELQNKARRMLASAGYNEEVSSMEELDLLKEENASLKESLASKETEFKAVQDELNALKIELATLKSFKAEVEQKEADRARLAEIEKRFTAAGITKDEKFWTEKGKNLLKLEDSEIDFMIQEMVAFKTASASTHIEPEPKPVEVPMVPAVDVKDLADPALLAKALREMNKK